ncbi:hypothetical protein [Streptomyces sp. NPDC018031]|uniref:LppU/SCO3897 family protein n=1 Tax=Streptomyces sp. NPDC018031 TaxID=3365033 RepID=UPI003791270A
MTTPPPQGQNPFAQQPAAPQGQLGAYPAPPAPEPPRRSKKKIFRNVILPIAGVSIAIGAYFAGGSEDDTKKLAVGDCLQNKGTTTKPEIEQLDCTDTKAAYKVLKKADGAGIASLTCDPRSIEGAVASITWEEGSDSFTLCLGDNKKK